MKTYKQMADAVLSARDDYLRKKQRQKILFYRYAPVMASFSFAVLIGLHVWKDKQALPRIPDIPSDSVIISEISETSETESSSETETFPASQTLHEIPAESETISAEIQVSETITTAVSSPETHTETRTETFSEATEPVPESNSTEEISIPIAETETPVPAETVITTEHAAEISTEITVPVETAVQPMTEIPPTELLTEQEETVQPQNTEPCEQPETESQADVCEDFPAGEDFPEIEPEGTAKFFRRIVLHLSQSVPGQETTAEEDIPFNVTGYTVPEENIGEWFDTVDVIVSYPDGTSRFIEGVGNAYLVQGMPFGSAAAVQFTGENVYYLFRNSEISSEEFRQLLSDSGILFIS